MRLKKLQGKVPVPVYKDLKYSGTGTGTVLYRYYRYFSDSVADPGSGAFLPQRSGIRIPDLGTLSRLKFQFELIKSIYLKVFSLQK
jgi:hypothetical protein